MGVQDSWDAPRTWGPSQGPGLRRRQCLRGRVLWERDELGIDGRQATKGAIRRQGCLFPFQGGNQIAAGVIRCCRLCPCSATRGNRRTASLLWREVAARDSCSQAFQRLLSFHPPPITLCAGLSTRPGVGAQLPHSRGRGLCAWPTALSPPGPRTAPAAGQTPHNIYIE